MAEEVSKSRSVFAAIVTSGLGAAADFVAGAELFGEEELVGAADVEALEALEAAAVLVSGAASVLLSTAAGAAESSPSSLPAPRNRKATKATMASSAIIATAITHPATKSEADLLAQVSVYASDADVKEYFDLEISTPGTGEDVHASESSDSSTSASGNAQADADFEAMMRSLGMEEKDFLSGDDDEKS